MFDYARWLQRAEAFVRGLNELPGQWEISVDVEPPLSVDAAEQLRRTLPLGLPVSLLGLYTTGSARFQCSYRWSPDEEHLPIIAEVFPHQYTLYGGARFIPAVELAETQAAVREWAVEWDAPPHGPPRAGWELWHQCVPFLSVGNGDHLAIRVRADDQPVLYLCHDAEDAGDGRTAFEISPSFDQFLADWETLCYVGPEIWLLARFLADDGNGLLEVDQPIAARWREVIDHFGGFRGATDQ